MPSMNSKNMSMSPAMQDLGLGAQLQQQLQDDDEERKKKLLKSAQRSTMGAAANSLLGPQSIFG